MHVGEQWLRRKGDHAILPPASDRSSCDANGEEIAEAHLTYKETRKRDGMRAKRTPASLRNTVPSSPGYIPPSTTFHRSIFNRF